MRPREQTVLEPRQKQTPSGVYFYNEGPADVFIHVFQSEEGDNSAGRTYLPMRVGVQYAVSNQFRMYSRVNVEVVNLTLLPAYVYWAPDLELSSVHAFVKAYPSQGIDIQPFLKNVAREERSWATHKPFFSYQTLQQFPPQMPERSYIPTVQAPEAYTCSPGPHFYAYERNPSNNQLRASKVIERLAGKLMDQEDMLKLIALNTLGTTKYQTCFVRINGDRYTAGDLLVLRDQQILAVLDANYAVAVVQGVATGVQLTDEVFGQLEAVYRIIG